MDRDDRQRVLSLCQLPGEVGRYFIDMEDVVLESSEREAQVHRAGRNHSDHLKEQEEGLEYPVYLRQSGCSEEVVARDETQDVEAKPLCERKLRHFGRRWDAWIRKTIG